MRWGPRRWSRCHSLEGVADGTTLLLSSSPEGGVGDTPAKATRKRGDADEATSDEDSESDSGAEGDEDDESDEEEAGLAGRYWHWLLGMPK